MAKNIRFIVRNVPSAARKGEAHLNKAIKVGTEVGVAGFVGLSYFDLGLLHKAKKRTDQARECISKAIQLFEQCKAEVYLKQAKEALASLG